MSQSCSFLLRYIGQVRKSAVLQDNHRFSNRLRQQTVEPQSGSNDSPATANLPPNERTCRLAGSLHQCHFSCNNTFHVITIFITGRQLIYVSFFNTAQRTRYKRHKSKWEPSRPGKNRSIPTYKTHTAEFTYPTKHKTQCTKHCNFSVYSTALVQIIIF